MTRRQIFQSIGQFLSVFITGLLVYSGVPQSLDQLWLPTLQGLLAALAILGVSRAGPSK